jgi:pimeloyl-ACP methyl ester carboxylesterase
MKRPYRITAVATLTAALLLAACAPKAPRVVTGTATSADQVAIKYEVAGQGEPALVFVHCWTCDRGEWDAQAGHFAQHHQVVRLDLAGHGQSAHARKDYTVAAFAADVVAVADQLGLKRVILVGSSMGGPVSVEAAKRLGDRVVGVVGVDSFYTGFEFPKDPNKAKEMIAGFLKPLEDNYAEASAKFMTSFLAPGADPQLVERIGKATAAADRAVALSAMRHNVEWYPANTPAALEALGPKLRNINANPKGDGKPLHPSVVLVAGAGHFIPLEKPAEFNQALEKIVQELAPTAATRK